MNLFDYFDESTEFFTAEQCYIIEMHNNKNDDACSIARARVAPGVTTTRHKLVNIIERYVIISGMAEVQLDGQASIKVGPWDVVNIPANITQQITNIGQEDLLFLCICTPRFQQQQYVDLSGDII